MFRSVLDLISRNRSQYRVLAVLAVGSFVVTGLLNYFDGRVFQRVLGDSNPLFVALMVVALSFVCLSWLFSRGGFAIYRSDDRRGVLHACGLAALFGIIVIPVDLLIRFPADINVPLPVSLLFYPLVGYFGEIFFHVLPLTLLLLVAFIALRRVDRNRIIGYGIVAVATLEPIYQTLWMMSLEQYPIWALVVDAMHVFAINFAQLIVFRRYDFISMITLRWVYYLFWHIGWGYFRLEILY